MQNRLVQSLKRQKIKYKNGPITLHLGDAGHIPYGDGYFHTIVTSPPYYRLRKYSGDQAAMIAWTGLLQYKSNKKYYDNLKLQDIDINPHWRAEQVNVTWL